ncbi:MAG: ABC transporter ATP-binding protein [Spirochaetales bacterium]|nr:ABC transporter ATP-binding protein [Spirochaetales bacterium]
MKTLLEIKDAHTWFPLPSGFFGLSKQYVKAVRGVDLALGAKEIVGLVGESGCGKTTVGRSIFGLAPLREGSILFKDRDLSKMDKKERFNVRRNMALVFQDPHSSLSPRMMVKDIVAEPLVTHTPLRGKDLRKELTRLLELVGLREEHLDRYPNEFSGGQRQRIGIARALALNPEFLVLDEPTSALDVSVQAQVLNLLLDLHEKLGLSYLFISHDLVVVKYLASRILVMYCGKVVEEGKTEDIFSSPAHPYTKALLSAIPLPEAETPYAAVPLPGTVPSPVNLPSGCAFHTRCPAAKIDRCCSDEPGFISVNENHRAACHLLA